MTDRPSPKASVNISIEESTPWEASAIDLNVDQSLAPAELAVLRRVAQGVGLFRLLDSHLTPVYDFGPSEPVESATVERLLDLQAIQFQGPLGHRLPMRAHLTSWGRALLQDRR